MAWFTVTDSLLKCCGSLYIHFLHDNKKRHKYSYGVDSHLYTTLETLVCIRLFDSFDVILVLVFIVYVVSENKSY